MSKSWKTWALAAALACAFVAGPSRQVLAQAGPCQKDAERLCQDVEPGEGRILQCLKAHQNELSPECVANMGKAKAKMKKAKVKVVNWQKACHADAKRLCEGVPYGEGRIITCLQEHMDQVSPECKGAMGK